MANPIGGLGQASSKMMEEIQKQAQQQLQKQDLQVNKFNDVMAQQNVQGTQNVQQAQQVNDIKKVEAPNKAVETLMAAKIGQADSLNAVQPAQNAKGGGFSKLLGGIVDGQSKLDDIIKLATSGKKFGNQELLAIQAGVYKYSQELELTSKVVEKATSGIKQTMQTQV